MLLSDSSMSPSPSLASLDNNDATTAAALDNLVPTEMRDKPVDDASAQRELLDRRQQAWQRLSHLENAWKKLHLRYASLSLRRSRQRAG
jgi:hypothetical protein